MKAYYCNECKHPRGVITPEQNPLQPTSKSIYTSTWNGVDLRCGVCGSTNVREVIDAKQISWQLQQAFDSIQDGDNKAALQDIKNVCEQLGHPIEDECEEED